MKAYSFDILKKVLTLFVFVVWLSRKDGIKVYEKKQLLKVNVSLVEGVSKNNKDYAYLDLRIDNCPDFEPKPYWLSKMELNYIKAQLDLKIRLL